MARDLGSAYVEGMEQGRKSGESNPFVSLLRAVNDSMARRTAEDQERRKEERQLQNVFLQLGKKHEYDTELAKQKAQEEQKTELFKSQQELKKESLKGWQKRKEEISKTETEMTGAQKLLETFGMQGEGRGGGLPEGVSIKAGPITFTGKQTAEEKGIEASTKESFERVEGIKRAAKKLAS